MAARDGGLGFMREAGARSSTASWDRIDGVEMEAADVSRDNALSVEASLQGVLIVRFFAYTVLAVSMDGGAQVLTALRASVATATVTIL